MKLILALLLTLLLVACEQTSTSEDDTYLRDTSRVLCDEGNNKAYQMEYDRMYYVMRRPNLDKLCQKSSSQ